MKACRQLKTKQKEQSGLPLCGGAAHTYGKGAKRSQADCAMRQESSQAKPFIYVFAADRWEMGSCGDSHHSPSNVNVSSVHKICSVLQVSQFFATTAVTVTLVVRPVGRSGYVCMHV